MQFNPRSTAILAVAKASNLDLDIVTISSSQNAPDSYRKLNALAKIPTFVGCDGYVLTECIAIALYCKKTKLHKVPLSSGDIQLILVTVASKDEQSRLLGSSKEEFASILRWLSFANSEILPALGGWFNPLIGRSPFNKQGLDDAMAGTLQRMQILEKHLSDKGNGVDNTLILVGESLSLADLFVAGVVAGGFRFFFDNTWRKEHESVTRWFEYVSTQPILVNVAGKPVMVEKAIPNTPPKQGGAKLAEEIMVESTT